MWETRKNKEHQSSGFTKQRRWRHEPGWEQQEVRTGSCFVFQECRHNLSTARLPAVTSSPAHTSLTQPGRPLLQVCHHATLCCREDLFQKAPSLEPLLQTADSTPTDLLPSVPRSSSWTVLSSLQAALGSSLRRQPPPLQRLAPVERHFESSLRTVN